MCSVEHEGVVNEFLMRQVLGVHRDLRWIDLVARRVATRPEEVELAHPPMKLTARTKPSQLLG